jgi:hypothetical protein
LRDPIMRQHCAWRFLEGGDEHACTR